MVSWPPRRRPVTGAPNSSPLALAISERCGRAKLVPRTRVGLLSHGASLCVIQVVLVVYPGGVAAQLLLLSSWRDNA